MRILSSLTHVKSNQGAIGRAPMLLIITLIVAILVPVALVVNSWSICLYGPIQGSSPSYLVAARVSVSFFLIISTLTAVFLWWILAKTLCSSRSGFLNRPPKAISGAGGLEELCIIFYNGSAFSQTLFLDGLTSYQPIWALYKQLVVKILFSFTVISRKLLMQTFLGNFLLGWIFVDAFVSSGKIVGKVLIILYVVNTLVLITLAQWAGYRARLIEVIGYLIFDQEFLANHVISRAAVADAGFWQEKIVYIYISFMLGAVALLGEHERVQLHRSVITDITLTYFRNNGYSEGAALRARSVSEAEHRANHPSLLESMYDALVSWLF